MLLRKGKNELTQIIEPFVARDASMFDSSMDEKSWTCTQASGVMFNEPETETAAHQARCPSPLFFSTTLLTIDDLIHDAKPKGKGISPLIKAHRKRASSMRLRTPAVPPRTSRLGPVSYHRRRLPGNHLHSPRHVPGVPSGSPRVRPRFPRPGQSHRAEGVEDGSRQ